MTPKIDLSKYVGKKVRVTFRNGTKHGAEVFCPIWHETGNETFNLTDKPGNPLYDSSGIYLSDSNRNHDIIHIKEIQMNDYQELENKVKEMQAEIDRLKAQEQKEVRSFRNDVRRILCLTQISRQGVENLTDKICNTIEIHFPERRKELAPSTYDLGFNHGYNDAIREVRKNLGL